MTLRWIVDVDGRGTCRVAADVNGRSVWQGDEGSREACERLITTLRSSDAAQTARSRRDAGLRLAASMRPHPS